VKSALIKRKTTHAYLQRDRGLLYNNFEQYGSGLPQDPLRTEQEQSVLLGGGHDLTNSMSEIYGAAPHGATQSIGKISKNGKKATASTRSA
jgi:hypothetical protein